MKEREGFIPEPAHLAAQERHGEGEPSAMVYAVGRAIVQALRETQADPQANAIPILGRAAIEAMREPTPAMEAAALDAEDGCNDAALIPRVAYRAMVDAALK